VICTLREKTKHIEHSRKMKMLGVFQKLLRLFANAINTAEKDKEFPVDFLD